MITYGQFIRLVLICALIAVAAMAVNSTHPMIYALSMLVFFVWLMIYASTHMRK